MHLPLSIFSSVCLRTSNSLRMGEFNKSLKYTLVWGHFVPFLGRTMCFMIHYALLFLFCTWVWFFSVFCRFLHHFTLNLTINECILTPYIHRWVVMPMKGRKNRRVLSQSWPRMVRVVTTVRGVLISPKAFCFVMTFWPLGSFEFH